MAKTTVIKIDTTQATTATKDLGKSFKLTRAEIKALKDEMLSLEKNSDAWLENARKVGELEHSIADVRDAVRGASADLGDMLGNVTKVGAGLSGAFSAAAAAMNLFGVESETTIKALSKVQSLMAITQGLAQIQPAIDAWKRLSTALKSTTIYQNLFNKSQKEGNTVLKAGAVVTGLFSKVMSSYKSSTLGATIATKTFSLALKSIGIGILLEGINLLIAGVERLINWFQKLGRGDLDAFAQKLTGLNGNLEVFKARLADAKDVSDFVVSLRKGWYEIAKMNNELGKLNQNLQTYLGIQNQLSGLFVASGLENTVAQYNLLEESIENLKDAIYTVRRGAQLSRRNESYGVPSKLYEEWLGITSDRDGILKILRERKEVLESISKIINEAATAGRALTNEEQKFIKTALNTDNTKELVQSVQQKYEALVKMQGLARKEIDNLNLDAQKQSNKSDKKAVETFQLQIQSYQSLVSYIEEAKKQVSQFTTAYNNALIDIAQLQQQTLTSQQTIQKEEAETFKAQIDGLAARDESYKNSALYLEDQIKYNEQLLTLEQRGTSNYEKLIQTIINLRHELSKLPADNVVQLGASIDDLSVLNGVKKVNKSTFDLFDYPEEDAEEENVDNTLLERVKRVAEVYSQIRLTVSKEYEQLNNDLDLAYKNDLITYEQYLEAKKNLSSDIYTQMAVNAIDILNEVGIATSNIGDAILANAEYQLEAGKISQEQYEEQVENAKAFNIAGVVISTLAGIANATASIWSPANSYLTVWGQIGMQAAITTELLASMATQIALIKRQSLSSSSSGISSSSVSSGAVSSLIAPLQYTSNVEGASTEQKQRDTRVYVTEHDISDTINKVSVSQREATF